MKWDIGLIYILLFILQGCNPATNKIIPDETATKIFTPTELEGISRMIHFVDSIVSEKTGLTDINESYRAYLTKLDTEIIHQKGLTPLLDDTARFNFFETMDRDAFSAVWREGIEYINGNPQGRKHIGLNLEGKYMKYLQEIGKSDDRYAIIQRDIYMAGDVSPAITAWLLNNNHEIDFTIYKHRLWATIFLLRVGEPIEIPDNINSRAG